MAGRVVQLTRRDTGAMVSLFAQEIRRVEPAKDGRDDTHLLLSGPPRELFVCQADIEVKRLMSEP